MSKQLDVVNKAETSRRPLLDKKQGRGGMALAWIQHRGGPGGRWNLARRSRAAWGDSKRQRRGGRSTMQLRVQEGTATSVTLFSSGKQSSGGTWAEDGDGSSVSGLKAAGCCILRRRWRPFGAEQNSMARDLAVKELGGGEGRSTRSRVAAAWYLRSRRAPTRMGRAGGRRQRNLTRRRDEGLGEAARRGTWRGRG